MMEEEMIRKYYASWEKKDWGALDGLLARSFNFTSPNGDDHIDLASFHAACWPQAEWIQQFELKNILIGDHEAFVRYLCRTRNGRSFCNVEHFGFGEGKIAFIECYFGGTQGYPSQGASEEDRSMLQESANLL